MSSRKLSAISTSTGIGNKEFRKSANYKKYLAATTAKPKAKKCCSPILWSLIPIYAEEPCSGHNACWHDQLASMHGLRVLESRGMGLSGKGEGERQSQRPHCGATEARLPFPAQSCCT